MILEFATRRGSNGHRKYLGIDPTRKVWSRERGHWMCREDFTEIGSRDRDRMIEELRMTDYKEIDHLI